MPPSRAGRRLRASPRRAAFLAAVGVLLAGCDGDGDRARARGAPADRPSAGQGDPGFPLSVRDDAGHEVRIETPPERIVALVPAATEILRALGAESRLVGRTDYDRDPALAHLPSVGGGLHPSLERLVSLEPDLVVRYEGESDRATAPGLDAAGIGHLAVRPDTLGDIVRMIHTLSRVIGTPARGDSLVAGITMELDEIRAAVADADRPRVVFVLGGDPPWIAARGTFLHELVTIAGGDNVFGETGPIYAPVGVEEVLRRRPELVLAPGGASIPSGLRALPVRRTAGDVQAPGHRVAETARELARLLHPERFP